MKRIGFLMLAFFSLSGCGAQGTDKEVAQKPPKKMLSDDPTPVEMVSNADLGTRFCLTDSDGTPREQIRGLAPNKWTAMEAPKAQKKKETCDVGPIQVHKPSKDCPTPGKAILLDYDRLRIEPMATAVGEAPRFQVTVIDPANNVLCGKSTSLTFAAHLVPDEHATGKYKWLAGSEFYCDDGLSQNSKYQIYVYFVDTPEKPEQADIEKHYRIEFFNTNAHDCMKNAEVESPLNAVAGCQSPDKTIAEEPVGDGRQHRATQEQGECLYTASPGQ